MAIEARDLSPAMPPPDRMSFEEFLNRAEDESWAEWVDGEVMLLSPPSVEHQDVSGFLTTLLRFYAEENQLGRVLSAPFLMKNGPTLPGREPDILFVATQNLTRLQPNYLEGPADLVVEIISTESRTRDRNEKFTEYEQGGVREYWIVDPARDQAEFYQSNAQGSFQPVTPDANGIYRSDAMPGLWIEVPWLWRTPLPTLRSVLRAWGIA